MIEGLWIEMTSEKLRRILTSRAEHHHGKAEWYKQQADNLAENVESTNASNNPVASLRASQREHENKASFFSILAENIIPNETYRLSEQNCIRIEMYSQYF